MNKIIKILLWTILILVIIIIIYNNISFINYNYFKINNLLKARKLKEIKDKVDLLKYPLKDFMVNTSHNSYLNSSQHISIVNCNGIKFALEAGARNIEIDINNIRNNPVVAHGNKDIITTTWAKLENILDCIIKYGFKTSDPLIITIERPDIHNEIINNKIRDLLISKFGDKLYISDGNISHGNILIKDLINKVLVIGKVDDKNILKGVINHIYSENNFGNYDVGADEKKTFNNFVRVYPSPSIRSVLSLNIDFNKYKNYNYNAISINFQGRDKNLYDNLLFFKDYSFIHKSEISNT